MQTTLPTSLLTIGASLLLAVSISVHAQHAPYEDIFTVPGLFPSPLDTVLPSLPVLEEPEELDAAAEILWGSILGENNSNAQLSRALEGVQINLSGVLTIQGKKQLYVGIDKETYKNYDTAHIQETLAEVFPDIPIHVEPYAQIRLLQETPEKQQETLFSDEFTALDNWTQGISFGEGWTIQQREVPGTNKNNTAAVCTDNCTMETTVNLANTKEATIALHRFTEKGTLTLEINNTTLKQWTDTDTWHYHTVPIPQDLLSDKTTIKLTADLNLTLFDFFGNTKTSALDTITIKGVQTTAVSTETPPEETTQPTEPKRTIQTVTVSTETPEPGAPLTFTVQTGETTVPITLYRTTHKTDNPQTGTLIATTTRTFKTTAPETPATYYYYACTADTCTDPVVVTVKPAVTQPTEPAPDFTITSITAQKTGNTVSVQTTVANRGTQSANARPLTIYQHTEETDNPTTGSIVGTTTTGTVAAGAQVTKTITTTAPSGQAFYYACVNPTFREVVTDNNCTKTPATVTTPTITAFAVSTTTPEPGAPLTFTVQTGATTTPVNLYRTTQKTDNPRTGALVATTTRTFRTTAPETPGTYYYYTCTVDTCTDPVTVRVQQKTTPPEEPETSVTIRNVAPPTEGKASTIVRWYTRVTTEDSLQGQHLRVFQHTKKTNNPTTGGTQVFSKRISTTPSTFVNFSAPETPATYYYYVCINETCAVPVPVSVNVSSHPDLIGFTGGCSSSIFPKQVRPMGGEMVGTDRGCSTLTLGGLETIGGVRGFVIAGHSAIPDRGLGEYHAGYKLSYTRGDHVNILASNGVRRSDMRTLGRVMTIPTFESTVYSFGERGQITADAAFVAYPRRYFTDCTMTWQEHGESFCFDFNGNGPQLERVVPLAIRGKNGSVYKVVGSQKPPQRMWFTGIRSGVHDDVRLESEKMLIGLGPEITTYAVFASLSKEAVPGDSGGPVYSIPDTNGNVHIVGIHYGGGHSVAGSTRHDLFFSSWQDVTTTLDLKPIR